jgi:hypothetical protein
MWLRWIWVFISPDAILDPVATAPGSDTQAMRTFVRLRQILTSNADLARKLEELESKYDRQFKVVFDAIRQMMSPPPPHDRKQIGFR